MASLKLILSVAALSSILLNSALADELSRILLRNRGFVVRMDEEDYGKVAPQLSKYECTSLFSGGTCTHHVGGGFEQYFTTTTSPPTRTLAPRRAVTQHVTDDPGSTIAQNIILEALFRQHQHGERSRDFSAVNSQSERALSSGDDRSMMDIFLDPKQQRTQAEMKEVKAQQAARIMDDKHDGDSHVVNRKRQRFSHFVFPDDAIVSQRPSHSSSHLAALLGDFQRRKGHQYTPGAPNPQGGGGGMGMGAPPPSSLEIQQSADGQMTISASINPLSFVPVDHNDPLAVTEYLANMSEDDVETSKHMLEAQLRSQVEGIEGIQEEQVDAIVAQLQEAYVKSLAAQIEVAKQQVELVRKIQDSTGAVTGTGRAAGSGALKPTQNNADVQKDQSGHNGYNGQTHDQNQNQENENQGNENRGNENQQTPLAQNAQNAPNPSPSPQLDSSAPTLSALEDNKAIGDGPRTHATIESSTKNQNDNPNDHQNQQPQPQNQNHPQAQPQLETHPQPQQPQQPQQPEQLQQPEQPETPKKTETPKKLPYPSDAPKRANPRLPPGPASPDPDSGWTIFSLGLTEEERAGLHDPVTGFVDYRKFKKFLLERDETLLADAIHPWLLRSTPEAAAKLKEMVNVNGIIDDEENAKTFAALNIFLEEIGLDATDIYEMDELFKLEASINLTAWGFFSHIFAWEDAQRKREEELVEAEAKANQEADQYTPFLPEQEEKASE